MTSSTISTVIHTEVTLGSATAGSPLTITSSGEIDYAPPGFFTPGSPDIALTMPGVGSVSNYGTITETAAGFSPGFEAILISGASTLQNFGVVLGQPGAPPSGAQAYNGGGGVNLSAAGASLLNAGTISGGMGGATPAQYGVGGTGGYGVQVSTGASVANLSTIVGGSGGAGAFVSQFDGGHGGAGINIEGGTVTNNAGGLVIGGAYGHGRSALLNGAGGNGVIVGSGTLTNDGTILGGAGPIASTAGNGLAMSAGYVANFGDISGGAGTIGGIGAVVDGGVLENSGTIVGTGTQIAVSISSGTLINSGTITAGPNADAIVLNGSAAATLVLKNGSEVNGNIVATTHQGDVLELSGTGASALTGIGESITNFATIDFAAGSSWMVAGSYTGMDNDAGFNNSNVIQGFAAGDTIDLNGFTATQASYISGTGLILSNATTSETLDFVGSFASDGFQIAADGSGGTLIEVTCYAQGTHIATDQGETPVEALKIGDSVKTLHAGLQKVKWVGQRSYVAPFANHVKVLPICIRAGAIADGIPQRDLYVSPGHAICIDGVLVHASNLVNGVSITQASSVETITYFHVELENHEIIFAEGCPAETFMGEYFRQQFHNAAEYQALYPGQSAPDVMCLVRLDSGFHLQAIRQAIADRVGLTSSPQEAGMLRGFVDQTGPNICFGWAQDMAAPEEPVCLDIFSAGQRVGRALANLHRADVRDAGLGSGRHGFEFILPPHLPGPVDVRRAVDGVSLPLAGTAMAIAA